MTAKRVVNIFVALAAAFLAVCPAPSHGQQIVRDAFLGRNVVGPYLLTWKAFDSASVVVYRGAVRQLQGSACNVDAANGVAVFSERVRPWETVTVEYAVVPGRSAVNAWPTIPPLSLRVASAPRLGMALTVGVAGSTISPLTKSLVSGQAVSVGLQGQGRLGALGTVSAAWSMAGLGADVASRSTLSAGAEMHLGPLRLTGRYARLGSSASSQGSLVPSGHEAADLIATGRILPWLSANASFVYQRDVRPGGRGVATMGLRPVITTRLWVGGRLDASRSETISDALSGSASRKTTEHAQVSHRLGTGGSATVTHDRVTTTAADGASGLETTALVVRASPRPSVSVQADAKRLRGTSTEQDSTGLRLTASPTSRLSVSAATSDQMRPSGVTRNRELAAEVRPAPGVKLAGAAKLRTSGSDETYVASMSGEATPLSGLALRGVVSRSTSAGLGAGASRSVDAVDLQMSWRLGHESVRMTSAYAVNPANPGGIVSPVRRSGAGFEADYRSYTVGANYSLEAPVHGVGSSIAGELSLRRRFGRATSAQASLKRLETQQALATSTDILTFGLTHRLGAALDFSLNSTLASRLSDGMTAPDQEYRAEAKLGMRF